MTKTRRLFESFILFLITFIKIVAEWLPFMSIFIFAGALIYYFLSHLIGMTVMCGIPIVFCLLKAWADSSK